MQGPSSTASSAASGESIPLDEAAAAAESAQQQHQASEISSTLDSAAGAKPDHQQHQASGAAPPLGRRPAESAKQQHEAHVRVSEMATDSSDRSQGLEHVSSGAKRHADRDRSDSSSPMKRQELEQQPTSFGPAAVTAAGGDTAMTHAFEPNTASAGDDTSADDKAADSDAVMTQAFGSNTASAAGDTSADDALDSDAVMTHALASDIASAADDKGMAADNDGALSEAAHQEDASAAGTHFKTHAEDSQEDTSAAGTHFMTHADQDSDAGHADRVMLDLDDEMEGLISSADDRSKGTTAENRVSIEKGTSLVHHSPPNPLSPYMLTQAQWMSVGLKHMEA